MTDSKYTFTDLSGSFELTVELDDDNPEPVPDTCNRAVDELTGRGLIPRDALVTNVAASSQVAGFVRCSVSWVAANLSTSLIGD